ncbi:Kinesin-like protein kif9 [Irineochytrium annulatum]|nr:Kinesin-like protein kif9 [Irineochytrium annulatum]
MSKHVRVVIRTRPTSDFASEIIRFDPDNKGVHIHIPKGIDGGYINNQQEDWDFRFDNILHNSSQEKVYEECSRNIVRSTVDGYNGTVMAYGQTGAGKTFTMTGATENYKHRGLIPRAISHVFREVAERPQMACTVRVSYLEIYNEQIVDLLATVPESAAGAGDAALAVVEDKNGLSHVKGATVQVACNEEEALNLLFEGETNRSISEHQLNKNSTRSHCIFTLYLESRSRVESTEKVIFSKLNLVDLAGSERISKTHTEGVSLKEAMYINKSLTFLEQVIIALADKKREHIPYRQSKLTHVLRDSLGGNCNTLMIANIWGEREHVEETISTLRFATRMMCVTNTPEVNVQFDPLALIKKYERDIRELKQELAMHDSLSNRSHVQYEAFGEQQRMELMKQVRAYLEDDENELEIVNLRQTREFFRQFKVLHLALQSENEDLAHSLKKILAGGGSAGSAVLGNLTGNGTAANGSVSTAPGMNVGALGADGGDDGGGVTPGAAGRVSAEYERDDRVGDVELFGFSVGLAPAAPKGAKGNAAPKQRKKPSAVGTTKAELMGFSAAQHPQDDGDDEAESARDAIPSLNINKAFQNGDDGMLMMSAVGAQLPPLPSQQQALSAIGGGNGMYLIGGGKHNNFRGVPQQATSRAQEFEAYKRGEGAEIFRVLSENKVILKEKKKMAKDLVEIINEAKSEIDRLKANVSSRKPTDGGKLILDEQEFEHLERLKLMKRQYRDNFDALKQTRIDIAYCTKLVDQCRQKLMGDFESWYEAIYGAQMAEMDVNGVTEDVMDIGEKFDRLQIERMSQEDPDSLPYYNARKNTERRNTRVKGRG